MSLIDLNKLPKNITNYLINKYPNAIQEKRHDSKIKSEATEKRIRDFLKQEKPKSTEYDFMLNSNTANLLNIDDNCSYRFELKQTDMWFKGSKIQQVKPHLYDYILICMNNLGYSEWYLLNTNKISKFSGKENTESGKICLNRQHKDNLREGQITFSKDFYEKTTPIGKFKQLNYEMNDLNLSNNDLKTLFLNIYSNIILH